MVACPVVVADIEASIAQGTNCFDEARAEELARKIGAALGATHTRRGRRSAWRPGLVEAFIKVAGDPDGMLADWLENGAPTGVASDIIGTGVILFAAAIGEEHTDFWKHWAMLEMAASYANVTEHEEQVKSNGR